MAAVTSRKQPSAAFWATVVLVVLLVGYPLSMGPACWLSSRTSVGASMVSVAYRPLLWLARAERIAVTIGWYSELGSKYGWSWVNDGGWTWRPKPPSWITSPQDTSPERLFDSPLDPSPKSPSAA